MSTYFSRPSSSAIPIVDPSKLPSIPADEPSDLNRLTKKDSTQRQCRNVVMHGTCWFEGKGCVYQHPPKPGPSRQSTPTVPAPPVATEMFPGDADVPLPTTTISAKAPEFIPKARDSPSKLELLHDTLPYEPTGFEQILTSPTQEQIPSIPYQTSDVYSHPNFMRRPLNYHLYTLSVNKFNQEVQQQFSMSDDIREELLKRSEAIHTAPFVGLPEEIHTYHSLCILESTALERRKSFGAWYSTCYRGTSSLDGNVYALRRIENFRLMHESPFGAIEFWSRVHHPNIVTVREAFTTRAFNDNSLVIVYDFHPNAMTLYDVHLKPKPPAVRNGKIQPQPTQVPERLLWTYIIQIANALKSVHDQGLAVRVLDITKVLVTGQGRVRLNCCGVLDVVAFDGRKDVALLQQEDLVAFGKLIFTLCCSNSAVMNNLPKALETISRHYSSDLKNIALFLISKPGPHKVVGQLFDMFGGRLLSEMDSMQLHNDRLENELMTELENARLVRLLSKLGFINERPEFDREPRWSETGDRYIIKLFRDYVFHQVDENGSPVVNLSHVLTCLNKLDAGTDERIMLVARDEQSCLVVTYKEIKACVDAAFSDLGRGYSSTR